MQTEFNAMVWWDLRNSQEVNNNNSGLLYGWRQYGDYGILSGADDPYPAYYVMAVMASFAREGDQIITATSDYDLLSVYAAKRINGKLSLLVINKSPFTSQAASIQLTGFTPQANATVTSYGIPQDEAARTGGNPDPASSSLSNAACTFTTTFAPYSVNVISLSQNVITDTDGDGIPDQSDNCTLVSNVNQRDTDNDGFGNSCDADLNNDLIVNAIDLGLFKKCYLKQAPDAQCRRPQDSDLNGDGNVNALDLGLFKKLYLKPPGPRGLID
jgi:hypothetical protein